jgi:hypothetical protein
MIGFSILAQALVAASPALASAEEGFTTEHAVIITNLAVVVASVLLALATFWVGIVTIKESRKAQAHQSTLDADKEQELIKGLVSALAKAQDQAGSRKAEETKE